MLDIKSCFTCHKSNFHGNTINCQNIVAMIVDGLQYISIHLNELLITDYQKSVIEKDFSNHEVFSVILFFSFQDVDKPFHA